MEKSRDASIIKCEIDEQLKMIISNLIGGLGNQMFQYAAGRAHSIDRNLPFRLDITGFANYGHHQGFELLRVFNCNVDIADKTDISRILGWQLLPGIRQVVSRPSMLAFRHKGYVVEPHFHYWHEIKQIPSNCYFSGYWQSEKYFIDAVEEIRNDFSFRLPLENENLKLAKQIDQTCAVSLHVRRGDYVHNLKAAAKYELCSLDYYNASIQHVAKRVRDPYFFIFSDDITWTKKHLKIDYPFHYVEHNHGAGSYNDMRLMSLCKHNIIANSSFSWWGAWLNSSFEKIVVAPSRWFADKTNTQDLIPHSWVKL